ncbi:MAG: hypothetical protein CMH57_13280 [Myxococcales bacterium]|nr:hypothetical protein [Myxococcales bacterium]
MMHDQIQEAILDQQVMFLRYRDGRLRIVEPYCYWETPRGQRMMRAYQRSGYSASGEAEGWKTFKVADIRGFKERGERFELPPREGYSPFDMPVARFFAMIAPDVPAWVNEAPPVGQRRDDAGRRALAG